MLILDHRTPLYLPALHTFDDDTISYAIDAESPNWIAADQHGQQLIACIDADPGTTFGDLVARYAAQNGFEGELDGAIYEGGEPLEWEAVLLTRTGRNEAVGARQIAGVVDLDPQLPQAIGCGERGTTSVGIGGDGAVRQHSCATG